MDVHLRNQHGSVHEVGLSDLMDALRLRGDLPGKRALIGIEPEDMDWGTRPTRSGCRRPAGGRRTRSERSSDLAEARSRLDAVQ